MEPAITKNFLRKLLGALWLRPESALWYAHMLSAAKEFLGQEIHQPALDFGCMDGVNTFILLGGEFDLSFDIFRDVQWDREAHKRSTLRDDYFDVVRQRTEEIFFLHRPNGCFEYGLDWKESHIQKASRLGIYRKIALCNPNQSLDGLDNSSFETIWAPNLYWVENLDSLLAELRRFLRPTGRLITIGPDQSQLQYVWFRYAGQADRQWLQDLDRGRYVNISRHARSLLEWEAVFRKAGLRVAKNSMFIPSLVGQVYDIGLRPMFPVFMNMYEKLSKLSREDLMDLKQHWIDTVYHFLAPLCDESWMDNMGMKRLWHIFELKGT